MDRSTTNQFIITMTPDNHMQKTLRILFLITIHQIQDGETQLAFANLTKVGIIPGQSYNLKITTVPSHQYLVVKLIPNMDNLSTCEVRAVDNYKAMLNRILSPINASLHRVRSAIHSKELKSTHANQQIVWGAVIGGIALGVATMAQITAGVALYNSIQNANAIYQMKDAIRATNKAVSSLQTSQARTIVAINALQDQINSQIVPIINTLGCDTVSNTLGLRLQQYFSEISLVFGPNLRDPASETLSIQAISRAFNGDFDTLIKTLGYSNEDFLDLLESESIRGRIIDVSLTEYYIAIQVEYPAITSVSDATIQLFNKISYSAEGSEWISVFPNQLLIRGGFLSSIDLNSCTLTTNSFLCDRDTSYPIGENLRLCALGDTSKCTRTRIVNSYVPRFALYQGVIYANCLHTNCRCTNPEYHINQDPRVTTVMISQEMCKEVLIDAIYITLGPKTLDRADYSISVETGGDINLNPIDIGNEVAAIQESLDESRNWLGEANKILDTINPHVFNIRMFGYLLAVSILTLLWIVLSLIWLIYLTKKLPNKYLHSESSGLVNPGFNTIGSFQSYGSINK
nr:fusion protein [Paramyxoviridae sp.]